MAEQARRVAVIGAGISGLATLRSLLASDRKYLPTCFERGSGVGGIWQYNENSHTDEYGMPVFSAMYRDAMSNLPKPMMEFPEFPNTDPDIDSCFMHRQEVVNYVNRFVDHFDLQKYITTHTYVNNVCPTSNERHPEWTVSYYDIRNKDEQKQAVFDAVFVCNGHADKPNIPDIDGVEEFQGEIIHSRNYRIPEKFKDKRIVILGASFSGLDLAVDISPYAQQIFLSHEKERLKSVFTENVTEKPGIKRMTRTTVVFLDDTEEEVDVLLFCTGYRYNFPFLSDDVININITDNRVMPLYKHVVNIKYQNLFFVGILEKVAFFSMGHVMSRFAVAVLDGKIVLPSETDMYKDAESDFNERKGRGEKAHADLGNELVWNYERELATLAGINPSPKAFQLIINFLMRNIRQTPATFRQRNIQILDDMESFILLN
ncbi:dimethylaniline monooxygenase [N-oxide-forming] 4-like [Mizuhopecten yessoensis]|uniref:Flavin-containing monooxygenase n=1 Tax=Mizuhopecten yessoensis TaxID=6573 RepID=A0A210Q4R7_MIZYE|nr:dimethylaniline monooxygenase [N-oxide-forming] 4-like [Mizuhopecten yessoensis]OWF43727.1 Senecionine N-oxygenase [Mizuhopecten yessoensis]